MRDVPRNGQKPASYACSKEQDKSKNQGTNYCNIDALAEAGGRKGRGGRPTGSNLTVHDDPSRHQPILHPSSILHPSNIAHSGFTAQHYERQQTRPAHHSPTPSNRRLGHAATHLASHKRWRYMWRNTRRLGRQPDGVGGAFSPVTSAPT
jgi:hypothetical protein